MRRAAASHHANAHNLVKILTLSSNLWREQAGLKIDPSGPSGRRVFFLLKARRVADFPAKVLRWTRSCFKGTENGGYSGHLGSIV
jgi:hypothetical protein